MRTDILEQDELCPYTTTKYKEAGKKHYGWFRATPTTAVWKRAFRKVKLRSFPSWSPPPRKRKNFYQEFRRSDCSLLWRRGFCGQSRGRERLPGLGGEDSLESSHVQNLEALLGRRILKMEGLQLKSAGNGFEMDLS